ncbi:MAG: hypothetical protein ACLP0J_23220, partial [Solirubrobacteraceae bacterium]
MNSSTVELTLPVQVPLEPTRVSPMRPAPGASCGSERTTGGVDPPWGGGGAELTGGGELTGALTVSGSLAAEALP